MFIGHFAVALAARPATPRTSLGWLFAAVQLPDLLWPLLLLAGVEQVRIEPGNTVVTPLAFVHYPWSHSLLTVTMAGALFGLLYLRLRRDWRGALVLALLVVSHWFLDALMHRPDLPLTPAGDARVGLGLWNSLPATLVLELSLFAAGLALYLRDRSRRGEPIGSWSISLWIFLVVVYIANIFGPPPTTATQIGLAALSMWLLVAWAARADRAGSPKGSAFVAVS